ncbi:MAG: PstS family phosphate ABC transporter substrate-binding protein [Thermodesulfobacteriaceae bacterium]|nr:PstS family phosphate ABC transporter substrate-binding protein [Thermodesulfobacteriaceae bacterium]MCX8041406.1 PstS family phosphate ABC transporter substrate-binding protein [Thermodesulfobacteriaceae bacterium]MDW8135824.1 PstS family phosphate ABC transporter substrate-binding protein [Thermodesulfobacterium sp.]
MKKKGIQKFLGSFLVGFSILGLVAKGEASKIIKIDGSSTVYPISEGVAEEFQKAKKGEVKVTVGISGTGGGFKKFCRGETDINDASRPILKKEMEDCKQNNIRYLELPIAYDGLAVVINPKNTWAKCMTVEQLKEVWKPESQGKKFTWADLDPKWPKEEVRLCGPGSDSGTFDYFTEAIMGKAKSQRGDYLASEDDNVLVQFAQREKGALCYFGLAYVEENKGKIKAAEIKNPKTGKCVTPSLETVKSGEYQPLSRPLFIYINVKSLEKPEVKEFVEFYIKNAGKISKQVGYIPLPDKAYDIVKKRFEKRVIGTVFGGEPEVGLTIEELLKKEAKE